MTFLAVRPRLSTVLSKFSHYFFLNFIWVSVLEGVTRGGPPSDATAIATFLVLFYAFLYSSSHL